MEPHAHIPGSLAASESEEGETRYRLHRRFDRMGRLVGDQQMERLFASHVVVIGLGGVGSFAAESLLRSGVGRLTLVDFDRVCVTNSNRQLQAMRGTVGKLKAQVLADRLRLVNPQAEIEVVARAGGQEVSDKQRVNIKDPIVLKLPMELDLGRVPAGSSWRINCQPLDFAGSRGVEEQEFLLRVELPPGCKSELGIVDGAGRFLPVGATQDGERRLTLGIDRSVKVCLEPPRCAGETPSPAILTVKPTSPDFPAEQATVRVIWKVKGKNFLLCNLWWLGILAGGLFFLFILFGFIRPYQFGIDDSVKIATKKEGLQRAVARRLRDLPGGKAGFYRSAATGLRDDGSATDRLRTAQLTLHAYRGDVMIRCKGSLLRLNPQTRKLDPVDVPTDGYAASRNTVYQVGTLFFQVS